MYEDAKVEKKITPKTAQSNFETEESANRTTPINIYQEPVTESFNPADARQIHYEDFKQPELPGATPFETMQAKPSVMSTFKCRIKTR